MPTKTTDTIKLFIKIDYLNIYFNVKSRKDKIRISQIPIILIEWIIGILPPLACIIPHKAHAMTMGAVMILLK